MRLGVDRWLPWAIAVGCVVLWVASAPVTLSSLVWQNAGGDGCAVGAAEEGVGDLSSPAWQEADSESQPGSNDQVVVDLEGQETVASGDREVVPDPGPTELPRVDPEPSSAPPSDEQATFVLCGRPDPEAERAIERLINGRSFRARLNMSSRTGGCAELTITVSPQSSIGIGRQSTRLSVSAGSGAVSVHIVTENGVTRATIGAAR